MLWIAYVGRDVREPTRHLAVVVLSGCVRWQVGLEKALDSGGLV